MGGNEGEAPERRKTGRLGHSLKSMMEVKEFNTLSRNTSTQGCILGILTASR